MKTPRQILDSLPPGRRTALAWVAVALAVAGAFLAGQKLPQGAKATATGVVATLNPPTGTPTVAGTQKATAARTVTPVKTPTRVPPVDESTETPTVPAVTATPSATTAATVPVVTTTPGVAFTPWPSAPLCVDHGELHDNSLWHGLWDSARGCHYDHEHGEDAFTPAVAAAFPGLNLQALIGGMQIGNSNPSSPIENIAKHGGFKWQVDIPVAQPCAIGFEGATVGIKASVVQYHAFGNYAIEFESRIHSALVLAAQCLPSNPNDVGYVFTIQHQEYGQRTSPYQGDVLAYPDNFQPTYASGFAPYLTIDCVGTKLAGQLGACRSSIAEIVSRNLNAASKWTSFATGQGARPETPLLFHLLFDVRDTYQVLDWSDQSYPYTFQWVCGNTAYNPAGCRYNNSTSTVHQIEGTVPAAWDNLAGWDTDTRVGRVTAEGFVSRFGMPVAPGSCLIPGLACFPVKLVNAFVGRWGADLCVFKCSLLTPVNTFDRDIYFLNGQVVSETTPGAKASGWIGAQN